MQCRHAYLRGRVLNVMQVREAKTITKRKGENKNLCTADTKVILECIKNAKLEIFLQQIFKYDFV
jgi:hypothetical protein